MKKWQFQVNGVGESGCPHLSEIIFLYQIIEKNQLKRHERLKHKTVNYKSLESTQSKL